MPDSQYHHQVFSLHTLLDTLLFLASVILDVLILFSGRKPCSNPHWTKYYISLYFLSVEILIALLSKNEQNEIDICIEKIDKKMFYRTRN